MKKLLMLAVLAGLGFAAIGCGPTTVTTKPAPATEKPKDDKKPEDKPK